MSARIGKYFNIFPDERRAFLRLALLFFVLYFSLGLFRVYVEAAFLKRYGPDNIPLMLLLSGLLSIAVFKLSHRLNVRFSDGTLLAGFLLLLGALQGGLYWGVQKGIIIAYPILFQLLYLKDAFLLVYLWNLSQNDFDARQGKRVFHLLMAAQVLGNTLGSLAAQPAIHFLGMNGPLAVCALGEFFLPLLLYRALFRRNAPGKLPEKKKVTLEATGLIEAVERYPIFRFLCLCALIPSILLPILTYQFAVLAADTFQSESALLVFVSWFRAATTLVIFLFMIALPQLYLKISSRNAALVAPLNLCLVFGGLSGVFSLFTAAYGQFSVILIQRAILSPVTKQLATLLPKNILSWAQVFVKGILSQTGMLVGAILMLLLKPLMTPREMAIPALALALFWVVEAVLFRKRYREGLKQVMVYEGLDYDHFSDLATGQYDPKVPSQPTLEVEAYPEEILTLMEEMDIPWIEPDQALDQLDHSDETIRVQAVASFSLTRDVRAVNRIIRLLSDSGNVRRAAMETLSRYGPDILPDLEEALLNGSAYTRRQILEIMRLTKWPGWDARPFIGKMAVTIYSELIAVKAVENLPPDPVSKLLSVCLREKIKDDLDLIFLGLWVTHPDMRLALWSIHSRQTSAAVELIETCLDPTMAAWILPLVDSFPDEERIRRGLQLFPLTQENGAERILARLANGEDPLIRFFSLCILGRSFAARKFYPLAERKIQDHDPDVRLAGFYCSQRCLNKEAEVPIIIQLVQSLYGFDLFKAMGIRELRAVASITQEKTYPSGSTIVDLQTPLEGIYLIVKGRIRKRMTSNGKAEVLIKGDFFGEMDLFRSRSLGHEYVAEDETELLLIRAEHLIEIIKLYPLIGLNLCRYYAERLQAG